jgi:ribosomal protein S27AE
MSELTAIEIHSEANTHTEGGVPTNHRTKVLSNTECPSCFRKGSMEVFIQKHGEHTFCYSCGYREMSFYS